MRKLIITLVVSVIANSGAVAQFSELPQEPQKFSTRFGLLTVRKDRMLLFKGHRLNPPIEGNNSLNLGKVFRIGATDVVLVVDNGGSACPYLYCLVSTTKEGAKPTPAFGTCAEYASIRRRRDSIEIRMPGFLGPFESSPKRRKAERERHVFVFRDGLVTEKR
jgi:hypothetical protein